MVPGNDEICVSGKENKFKEIAPKAAVDVHVTRPKIRKILTAE
jgi:hypothetical protein